MYKRYHEKESWLTSVPVSHGSLKDWNRVAAKLPGRTNKDCRKRWSKIGENVKKGAWDNSEDERLRSAVRNHGLNWTQVALVLQTRNADQCAKRWQNSLDPSLDHSGWSDQDDDRLLAAVTIYGRNWKSIKDNEFPGRSTTDIKNRHGIVLRRRQNGSGSIVDAQAASKFPNSRRLTEQSLMQESDDEEDSESPFSNYDMFLDENILLSAGPEGYADYGTAGALPDFGQGVLSESLDPYSGNIPLCQAAEIPELPLTGTYESGLQNGTVNLRSKAVRDNFEPDYRWSENSVSLSSNDVVPDACEVGQTANDESGSRTVLTLYNVEVETLNSILETAFRSKTKVNMETYH